MTSKNEIAVRCFQVFFNGIEHWVLRKIKIKLRLMQLIFFVVSVPPTLIFGQSKYWYWFYIQTFLFLQFIFLLIWFFLLDHNKIFIKNPKNLVHLSLLNDRVHRCSRFYNFCWHNSTSFVTLMINILIFRCADP